MAAFPPSPEPRVRWRRPPPSWHGWLGAAAAAALLAGWCASRAPHEPLLLQCMTEPLLLRSVKFADEPLRAVGGSRDAGNLIAAFGGRERYYDHTVPYEPELDGVNAPVVRASVVAKLGQERPSRVAFADDWMHLAYDVDIASGAAPLLTAATHRLVAGTVDSVERRGFGSLWVTRTAFSRDEVWALGSGGHFRMPGCTTGEWPSAPELARRKSDSRTHRDRDRLSDDNGWLKPEQRMAPEMGVAFSAFSPARDQIALVGVESWWSRGLAECVRRRDAGERIPQESWDRFAPETVAQGDLPTVKLFGYPKPTLQWAAAAPKIDWQAPVAPAFCGFDAAGDTLLVGWGRWKTSTAEYSPPHPSIGPVNATFVRIVKHRVADGAKLGEWPISLPGVFALATLGVKQESLVAATPEGLWRQRLDGADDWRKVDLPGVARITALKATRDRQHLLVGDAAGVLHVVVWP